MKFLEKQYIENHCDIAKIRKEKNMTGKKNTLNRRDFIKGLGLGVVGSFALGGKISCINSKRTEKSDQRDITASLYKKVTEPARVSLVKGNDRREIVYQTLKTIEDEVLSSIGKKRILIK